MPTISAGFLYRLFISLLLLLTCTAFSEEYYDEVFDKDGNVRPQYEKAMEFISGMSKTALAKFIRESKKTMSGDTPIAPLPRILTESEYQELKLGTEQRAKAIQLFLEDHYSGKQKYRNKIIPGEIIDQIISRTGEANYLDTYKNMKKSDRKFRFLYGPDIIRNKDGKWLVLEDNLGFVGGTPGDTIPARETYDGMMPELMAQLPVQNDPHDFMTDIMDEMFKLAKPSIGHHKEEGVMVMLSSPPYGDKEDVRMAEEFKKRGVILVTPNTGGKKKRGTSHSLVVRADGVYLQETSKYGGKLPEKKVGMLWMNAEHSWTDWEDPMVREKALIEEARDYLDEEGRKLRKPKIDTKGKKITHVGGTKQRTKDILEAALVPDPKTGRISIQKLEEAILWAQKNDFAWEPSVLRNSSPVPGLMRAIMEGKVQSNYMPGTEFVGDKLFHSYMEDIIKFYLKEKPILKNPKTVRLFKQNKKGEIVMDKEAIEHAMKNQASSVVKVVDGRGGDGINIGPKMTPEDWNRLREVLIKEFKRYVNQEYNHPSVIKDGMYERIGDIRMFSYIDENGAIVSTTPWGRSTVIKIHGASVGDDGKVNMSTGRGTLTMVVIVPDPKFEKNGKPKFIALTEKGYPIEVTGFTSSGKPYARYKLRSKKTGAPTGPERTIIAKNKDLAKEVKSLKKSGEKIKQGSIVLKGGVPYKVKQLFDNGAMFARRVGSHFGGREMIHLNKVKIPCNKALKKLQYKDTM